MYNISLFLLLFLLCLKVAEERGKVTSSAVSSMHLCPSLLPRGLTAVVAVVVSVCILGEYFDPIYY